MIKCFFLVVNDGKVLHLGMDKPALLGLSSVEWILAYVKQYVAK